MPNRRVLVVDDDEAVIRLVGALLREEKIEYDIAHDGFEALQLLSRQRYAVMLVDLEMPVLSGIELLKKMKEAIERTWRNEIIVYSIGIGYPTINHGDLKKIAAETGGRAFFPSNESDLDKAYAQIEEDLRSQNILSYQSSNGARDGSFRTIQVRVKNRKELTVRHRRGYFAKKDGE